MAETCPDCHREMIADESPNSSDDVTWLLCPNCRRAVQQIEISTGNVFFEEKAVTFQIVLSSWQRDQLAKLAGEIAPASYIRRLIAADAKARGITWWQHIPEVGARGKGRRKKA